MICEQQTNIGLKEYLDFVRGLKSYKSLFQASIELGGNNCFIPVIPESVQLFNCDFKGLSDLSDESKLFFIFVYNSIPSNISFSLSMRSHEDIEINFFIGQNLDSEIYFFIEKVLDYFRKILFFDKLFLILTGEQKLLHSIETYLNKQDNYIKTDKCYLWQPKCMPGSRLILTAGPSISAREIAYASDAAENGWNGDWSKYIDLFENKFKSYVGARFAISTSSCTGALQIALMTLGIGEGDEVIVPDQTWVATANAVRYVNATPVFADVELDTWNIDVQSVESLITPKTKAIIVVHMYGHPARMDAIMELAKTYQLRVIEDSAPAIGALWKGQKCGTFGDFACFSFQGAKLLVTGEGGMLVTSNPDLYAKAKKISDQGRNTKKAFWIDEPGVKFKMSNVQAAIGLGQLERVDQLIAMKRRIFSWYESELAGIPQIRLNKEVDGAMSIYWMTSIFLLDSAKLTRDELIQQLKLNNIDSRPVFPAISQYPIWATTQKPQPNALRIGQQAINLPSGVCLRKEEVVYVCNIIKRLLKV